MVDDEESLRWVLKRGLEKKECTVDLAASAEEALALLEQHSYGMAFVDIRMSGMDGLQLLEHVKSRFANLLVVIMTAQNTMENAVAAMKKGAFDYLIKPFNLDEVYTLVEKMREITALRGQLASVTRELREKSGVGQIIGKSPAMQEVFKLIGKVAESDVTVLLTGESGTGKELIPRAIHYNSRRIGRPFVVVNCAAIPSGLLESELFGHEKGSFTGATAMKEGKFELANGGTLFLDEVAEMDRDLQAKFLRILQEKEFERVGGKEPIRVDVRIIAATSRDLDSECKQGRFREDLYYRLKVLPIHLPPLRERREDIPLLVDYFLNRFADESGPGQKFMSPQAMSLLESHNWPGNVRELENVVKRAALLTTSSTILPEHLPDLLGSSDTKGGDGAIPSFEDLLESRLAEFVRQMCAKRKGDLYSVLLHRFERPLLHLVLKETQGNQMRAAQVLGINRNTLRKKILELGLNLKGGTKP